MGETPKGRAMRFSKYIPLQHTDIGEPREDILKRFRDKLPKHIDICKICPFVCHGGDREGCILRPVTIDLEELTDDENA